jgi:hypothetical protein
MVSAVHGWSIIASYLTVPAKERRESRSKILAQHASRLWSTSLVLLIAPTLKFSAEKKNMFCQDSPDARLPRGEMH